jgi:hypothetical protein
MAMGCQSHPIIETLKNKPVVHPIMGTSQDVLLKPLKDRLVDQRWGESIGADKNSSS